MVKLIRCGKSSYYIIYPLVFIIVLCGINRILDVINTNIEEDFSFIISIGLMFLSEILYGRIYFFDRYEKKNHQIKENKLNNLKIFPMEILYH